MNKTYILSPWPENQQFMLHPRWEECIFCESIPDHECPDSSYMIPEDLYNEVMNLETKKESYY